MKQIKARVVYNWNHPNHKFLPGDEVKVSYVLETESKVLQSRKGQTGKVIARSATSSGTARGGKDSWCGRAFTRYYVQFNDGEINGYHSHYIEKAWAVLLNIRSCYFMNKQYLKDTLAYVRYIHNNPTMSTERKYSALVSTLGHDLNGLVNEERCFSPRVTGYSKSARASWEAEKI